MMIYDVPIIAMINFTKIQIQCKCKCRLIKCSCKLQDECMCNIHIINHAAALMTNVNARSPIDAVQAYSTVVQQLTTALHRHTTALLNNTGQQSKQAMHSVPQHRMQLREQEFSFCKQCDVRILSTMTYIQSPSLVLCTSVVTIR